MKKLSLMLMTIIIYLICSGMALKPVYRLKNKRALNRIAVFHDHIHLIVNLSLLMLHTNK